LLFAFSCHRSVTTPAGKYLKIKVLFPFQSSAYQSEFELIISEPGGAVLLDTEEPFNSTIVANLHTDDTLVDVSTIVNDIVTHQYLAYTYRAVNVSEFSTVVPGNSLITLPNSQGQPAQIYYKNAPTSVPLGWFFNSGFYSTNFGLSNSLTDFSIQYTQHQNTYTYLYMPQSKLYKFHLPVSETDTVDLSQMDTAATPVLQVPSGDTITYLYLAGLTDSTNLNTALLLYTNQPYMPFGYPTKYIQKYQTFALAQNGSEQFFYSNFSDSVPSVMPFPGESSYTLYSTQNNNFDIGFNGVVPCYFATNWSSANIYWTVYQSPDSTNIQAYSFLTSLNSRMLAAQDLSALVFSGFGFQVSPEFSYLRYSDYIFNPSQIATHPISYDLHYFKSFP